MFNIIIYRYSTVVKNCRIILHGDSIYLKKIIKTAEGGISGVKGDVISLAGGE